MSRRPLVVALLIAIVVVGGTWWYLRPSTDGRVQVGEPAPVISGVTLDGSPFELASLRGKPVLINFWGPTCVPCREEMPLLAAKSTTHAESGFTIVGVLTDDPPEPARDFEQAYGATWSTVEDPDRAIKTAYRVVARPTSFFVDAAGIVRSVQQGYLTDADFERQFALIAPT
jgi:thiol-disulfide isomerase/thioredoxin